ALLANGLLRSSKVLALGVGLLAASAFVFGIVWPGIVQQFRDKPAASQLELPYIQRNIDATRTAFGLGDITTKTLPGTPTLKGDALSAQVARNAQIALLDPNRLSPTFAVQQQVRSFYSFKSTLDIDRYPVNGQLRDVAIATRELNTSGLPGS